MSKTREREKEVRAQIALRARTIGERAHEAGREVGQDIPTYDLADPAWQHRCDELAAMELAHEYGGVKC